jgi:signal transduction histidine kinase
LTWSPETPPEHHEPAAFEKRLGTGKPSFLNRIKATLSDALGTRAQALRVMLGPGGPPRPPPRHNIVFRPPEIEQHLAAGALKESEPEIAIPGRFRIEIQGPDGTWLTMTPRVESRMSRLWHWPLLPLIGGTMGIVVLSLLTARRILAPLGLLVHAAERLGTQREPVPVSTTGLGEFTAIADAFNAMQSRLKRFVDERTQMLAAVSHDLRTSLTRLELAADELPIGDQKSAITRELGEMEAMIAATLTFASEDAKAERSRVTDIATLLITLCDDQSDRGNAAHYAGPDHAGLLCQPLAMKRALTNVIDNAIKYGGMARVSLAMTNTAAIIEVRDEGPGISPEKMEEVFVPFRRLESSRSRATGGVGLGLTIARDVVHAHGGTIALGNGDPTGLIVTLTLPLPSVRDASGAEPSSA